MQVRQGGQGHARRTKVQPHAGDRIQHPRRNCRHATRCELNMHTIASGAVFAILPATAAAKERVPSVINLDLPPDMGRMSVPSS